MELDYFLRPYGSDIRAAYLGLLPEQEQEVASGKLDWKFASNPAGPGSIAVAKAEDRIVGMNAFMPGRFVVGGEIVRGYQSMDTIVSQEARGKGVFGKLIERFYQDTDARLIYGFPNLSSSPGFFGKLGWTSFGSVPMMIRPLRGGYFLKRLNQRFPDFPLPLMKQGASTARKIERFGEDATLAWRDFARGIGCALLRDADYLNWRLCDHPAARYSILQGEDGAFVAWLVADKHGGRVGYLMEAIGPLNSLKPLIVSALQAMKADRADVALAWCLPWSPNRRSYREAGFLPFPDRLRPVIINFGARAIADDLPQVREARSWYVSYLDSDTI